jgi:hypothetical protein
MYSNERIVPAVDTKLGYDFIVVDVVASITFLYF